MATTELMMILANSEKKGDKCVAGKRLTLNTNNTYNIHEWIRPVHPTTAEGEIPTRLTVFPGHVLAPLDVVSIEFEGSAEDEHHPEDLVIVKGKPWELHPDIDAKYLPNFCDTPKELWGNEPSLSRCVPEGFVPAMPNPFTLCLIRPEAPCEIEAYYEPGWQGGVKLRKKLFLRHNGMRHEFDITDTVFTRRHKLAEQAKQGLFKMSLDDLEKVFLCLSLTPAFRGDHYKIAAAIIEIP